MWAQVSHIFLATLTRAFGLTRIPGVGAGDYIEDLKARADQGHAIAQSTLGYMYKIGQGVPQDYVQAHKWYNLAASKLTGRLRASATKLRDRVATKMTPAQIKEAQRLAREWQPVKGAP